MKIIQTPGKFEGEPIYVPEYWDAVLNGCEEDGFDDGNTPVSVFPVTADDAKRWPDLADSIGDYLLLWESDQGFVNSRIVDADELNRIQAECETDSTEEE